MMESFWFKAPMNYGVKQTQRAGKEEKVESDEF